MNQRIRELADQMFGMEEFEYAEEFLNDAFMEKFAELIVQECVNVLHDNELWNRHISHALKEHFGVK